MSSNLSISGLSGIDTQEWLDEIMTAKRKPLDTLKQDQQLLLWKQEAYQDQQTSLSELRDQTFNLKLESNYSTKKVTSSDDKVATATATANAGSANYVLNVTKLASVAVNKSTDPVSIRSSVTGKEFDVDTDKIKIGLLNESFQIKLDDGNFQKITLRRAVYTGKTGLKDLAADIQKQLDATFTDIPVYVKVTSDNQLMFCAGQRDDGSAHTIVLNSDGGDDTLRNLGFSDYDSTKAITGSILTKSVTVNDTNNKFKISVGDVTQEITLDEKAYATYGGASKKDLEDLAEVIQRELKDLEGDFVNVKVSCNDYNQIVFNYEDTTGGVPKSLTMQSGSSNDILNELGIKSGTISEYPKNIVSSTGTLLSQKNKYLNSRFFDDLEAAKNDTFGFIINGQSFSFSLKSTATSSGASLSSIMNEINNNSAAGVSVYYDEFSDKLVMTKTKAGNNNETGNEIEITDTSGFFTNLLNIDPAEEYGGENAELIINGVETKRAGNSFTMNGVTFNLTDTGATTITVSTDITDVATKVDEFIDKYNGIITTVNKELTEERATAGDKKYYLPLTDEQREVLSDDQIEAWEKKAKQGILRRDSLLTSLVDDLRDAFSKTVSTPLTISGMPVADSINLVGANRITVTLGPSTREIVLDETSDTLEKAKVDLQKKLNQTFGQGRIIVGLDKGVLSLTTQNTALTLKNGGADNGLNILGLSDGATVSAGFNQLSQIGITTGDYTEKGILYFNKEAFQTALEKDSNAVVRLLTNFDKSETVATDTYLEKNLKSRKEEASKGIIYKINEILNSSIKKLSEKAGTSGTVGGSNAIGEDLNDLSERISNLEDRLDQEKERLSDQFATMEKAVSNMNSQASYFSSMLGS